MLNLSVFLNSIGLQGKPIIKDTSTGGAFVEISLTCCIVNEASQNLLRLRRANKFNPLKEINLIGSQITSAILEHCVTGLFRPLEFSSSTAGPKNPYRTSDRGKWPEFLAQLPLGSFQSTHVSLRGMGSMKRGYASCH